MNGLLQLPALHLLVPLGRHRDVHVSLLIVVLHAVRAATPGPAAAIIAIVRVVVVLGGHAALALAAAAAVVRRVARRAALPVAVELVGLLLDALQLSLERGDARVHLVVVLVTK